MRAALLIATCAALAGPALAARVGGETAPAPATVQGLTQQPATSQTDESASLRQGTITAVDAKGARLQVQGVWLGVVDGKTIAMRGGRPAELASLRVGETIRFTVAADTPEAASLRLIYAP